MVDPFGPLVAQTAVVVELNFTASPDDVVALAVNGD
jgi:hypothetical protein